MNRADNQTARDDRSGEQGSDTTKESAPHNLEAERSLLGAALLSKDALEVLATKTVAADFFSPSNQHVAAALIEAFEANQPADAVTIADTLKRRGQLDGIGGPATLITIQAETPATSNAARYAQIVHDDATLRRLMAAGAKVRDLSVSRPFDVHEAVEQAQGLMADVASQNGARTYSTLDMPDMGAILSGDLKQEQPSILCRSDGQALIYAGKMHVFQAEPGSAKSWIALFGAGEVLSMGGSVIFIDYEDSPAGITGRMIALGIDPAAITERFQYVRPSGEFGISERAEVSALVKRMNPDLIIIDGVAEAISRDGYDEDKNSDVVKWVDKVPRWLAQTGAAVVMIDHIAKDKEKSGRYARGAGHKLAAVDGVAYQIKIIHAFSRHKSGSVKLVVAKDRPGVFSVGETAAVVKVDPSADGAVVRLTIEKPTEGTPSDSWKPTKVMERISREIETAAYPLTAKIIIDLISATTKKSIAQDALARLQIENYLSTFKQGNTTYFRVFKPYRDGDKPLPPPVVQPTLADEWKDHEDELAKRRAHKQKGHDDSDPGPREPND